MSFIPNITCRRCGRQFSGIRSRCPYCGTRRVKQSDRSPASTASVNPETGAAQRAGVNTRWQLIFGAILLAAVLLAVIVLVSVSLNGSVKNTPVPTLPPVTAPPVQTPEPTPPPTPTPVIAGVKITYYAKEITDFSTDIGAGTQLKAIIYPLEMDPAPVVNWTSSDEAVATVDDTGKVTGVASGNATVTAECYGVTATCIVRV
ncbi:MAG: Ig-like domain-containing protein, partial [Oscillospiraceae bacterium]